MEATPQQRFLLTIFPRTNEAGRVLAFDIQHTNQNIPMEVILTIVRNWLREMDDLYYQKYKSA